MWTGIGKWIEWDWKVLLVFLGVREFWGLAWLDWNLRDLEGCELLSGIDFWEIQ